MEFKGHKKKAKESVVSLGGGYSGYEDLFRALCGQV